MKAQTFVKVRHIGLAGWAITIKIEAGCGITETLKQDAERRHQDKPRLEDAIRDSPATWEMISESKFQNIRENTLFVLK